MINKKIVALSGSPSKGWNSDTMLDSFIEGAREIEGVEIEKMYVADINCDHYSFINREGAMEHEKEFKDLLENMSSCDGLVIATPTYNFSVPAGLKNIIDRIRPIALDMKNINFLGQPTGKLKVKTFFLVSGGSSYWAQKLLFPLYPPFWLTFIFKYYGAKTCGSIFGGSLKATTPAKDNKKLLNKCKKAGRKFAKKVLKISAPYRTSP